MNFIRWNLTLLATLIALMTNAQSNSAEVEIQLDRTISRTIDSFNDRSMKWARIRAPLANQLTQNLMEDSRIVFLREYKLQKFINDLQLSVGQVQGPANTLVTLTNPELLSRIKEAGNCSELQQITLRLIELNWREILLEKADLLEMEGVESEEEFIQTCQKEIDILINLADRISIALQIDTNTLINYDSVAEITGYFTRLQGSAQTLLEFYRQELKLSEMLNSRSVLFQNSLLEIN